jgi:hypothetical protein
MVQLLRCHHPPARPPPYIRCEEHASEPSKDGSLGWTILVMLLTCRRMAGHEPTYIGKRIVFSNEPVPTAGNPASEPLYNVCILTLIFFQGARFLTRLNACKHCMDLPTTLRPCATHAVHVKRAGDQHGQQPQACSSLTCTMASQSRRRWSLI